MSAHSRTARLTRRFTCSGAFSIPRSSMATSSERTLLVASGGVFELTSRDGRGWRFTSCAACSTPPAITGRGATGWRSPVFASRGHRAAVGSSRPRGRTPARCGVEDRRGQANRRHQPRSPRRPQGAQGTTARRHRPWRSRLHDEGGHGPGSALRPATRARRVREAGQRVARGRWAPSDRRSHEPFAAENVRVASLRGGREPRFVMSQMGHRSSGDGARGVREEDEPAIVTLEPASTR